MNLQRAVELAAKWHGDQKYSDDPYIVHLASVMLSVRPENRVVAVLHDILEDTDIPVALIAPELSDDELEALMLLTRTENESYGEYILAISTAEGKAGEIATDVKLADLRYHLTKMDEDHRHLEPRYRDAFNLLSKMKVPA